ncbi:hypothetical protein HPP92_027845 [Vanilla planifolia]|uniref:Uncharacterized protein n=1 Tax=Vanilla planifolia TaxID=51239 RepID=A0A835P9J0_VANPL|nr:hypothetical protein HPP92_027845 [Vanilla planifolia]
MLSETLNIIRSMKVKQERFVLMGLYELFVTASVPMLKLLFVRKLEKIEDVNRDIKNED